MSRQRCCHRGAEAQRKPRYLCVSVSLRLVTVVVVATMASLSAQTRPTPQPPPRRSAPPPRTAPPPKREAPEPAEPKPAPTPAPAAAPAPAPAQAKAAADATPADAGAALYKKNGCYECHVNDAQGGPQGPRLGPNPIPFPRFAAYVRNPSGDMPPFTAKVVSEQDLQSIYAFLQSRPAPPPVKDIPLLAP